MGIGGGESISSRFSRWLAEEKKRRDLAQHPTPHCQADHTTSNPKLSGRNQDEVGEKNIYELNGWGETRGWKFTVHERSNVGG